MRQRSSRGLIGLLLVSLLTPLLGGCGPSYRSMVFAPNPIEVESTAPNDAVLARTLVAIHRVDPGDPPYGVDPSVEVRMRVENTGAETVRFDPAGATLLTRDLVSFQPPLAQPPHPQTLGPWQTSIVTVHFPFPAPAEDADLSELHLRWHLEVDGSTAPVNVTMSRLSYRRPTSYSYHVGIGWHPWFYGGYGWHCW